MKIDNTPLNMNDGYVRPSFGQRGVEITQKTANLNASPSHQESHNVDLLDVV